MQTKQVLEIIRRIEGKFSPIYDALGKLQEALYRSTNARPPELALSVIEISYMFGDFIEGIQSDTDSVRVLEAFQLGESLLKREFWFGVASSISQPEADRGRPFPESWNAVHAAIFRPYDRMVSCVKPLTTLTIPPDLLSDQHEDVLAVNVSDRPHFDLKVLAKVIGEVETLYDSVNRIFGRADAPLLQIVKIESGSSLRIDLKGLAETVKELKNAVLEIWSKHRHKKADEIIDQHRVVSSGIDVLTQIDVRVKKSELTNEDGVRLKRAIVQSTLGLFKTGALIDEIPPTEVVNNVKLLDGFAYRLLAAPREDFEGDKEMTAPEASLGTPDVPAPDQGLLPATTASKLSPTKRKARTRNSKRASPKLKKPRR
jgi:hypothetical protein